MTRINFTFEEVECLDCGHYAPKAILLSASSFSPPPSEYSYDGECPKCGSENTKVSGLNDCIKDSMDKDRK